MSKGKRTSSGPIGLRAAVRILNNLWEYVARGLASECGAVVESVRALLFGGGRTVSIVARAPVVRKC